MKTNDDVVETLMVMAAMMPGGERMTKQAAAMMVSDLASYSPDVALRALQACRRELTRFPTVADVLGRIRAFDGRPGIEEAWSICPKLEADSVVWTDEISQAWAVASSIEDQVAARMAFKEKYEALLRAARDQGLPVRWWATFGHDRHGRERAIVDALDKGRISLAYAEEKLPGLDFKNPMSEQVKKITSNVFKQIETKEIKK
jgi:hypothetical protein